MEEINLENHRPWPQWVKTAADSNMPISLLETVVLTLVNTTEENHLEIEAMLKCPPNLYKSEWINQIRTFWS